MFRMLKSVRRRPTAARASSRKPKFRPSVDGLERRALLAVYPTAAALVIDGTPGDDTITSQIRTTSAGVFFQFTVNGETSEFTGAQVPQWMVIVNGFEGNDFVDINTAFQLVANGGIGNDTLSGGWGQDTLNGSYGDDVLSGRGNKDVLDGSVGNDTLSGGADNDVLNGGDGANYLYGEDGDDSLTAGRGNDFMVGGPGFDTLVGGMGNDYMVGNDDDDWLDGGMGDDSVFGDAGNDHARGGMGNDAVYGGLGNDAVYGDAGNDTVNGEWGDDQVYGGAGADDLYGGYGNDTLVSIDGETTVDRLFGGEGTDSFWADEYKFIPVVITGGGGSTGPFGGLGGLGGLGGGLGTNQGDMLQDFNGTTEARNLHRVTRFVNGADLTLDGDRIPDPAGGTDYRDYASPWGERNSRPLFPTGGPADADVAQGAVGDCWLLAGLASAARANPNSIRQAVVDLGDGTFAVRVGADYVRVDADLPTVVSQGIRMTTNARLGRQGSLWVAVMEKAAAVTRGSANSYAALNGGFPMEAFQMLNGTSTWTRGLGDYGSDRALLDDLAARLSAGMAVAVGVNPGNGLPNKIKHAYTVVSINRDAKGNPVSILLRNPWGRDGDGAPADGDKSDGYITVTARMLRDAGGEVQWAFV